MVVKPLNTGAGCKNKLTNKDELIQLIIPYRSNRRIGFRESLDLASLTQALRNTSNSEPDIQEDCRATSKGLAEVEMGVVICLAI